MAYYNGKKVLSVVQVKEVEVDYYVGVATLENEKKDEIIVPSTIEVNNTNFPILDGTKTSIVELGGNSVAFNQLVPSLTSSASGGVTFTASSDGRKLTLSGTSSGYWTYSKAFNIDVPVGHKVLVSIKVKNPNNVTMGYRLRNDDPTDLDYAGNNYQQVRTTTKMINQIQFYGSPNIDYDGVEIEDVQIFDLTKMPLDNITSVDEFKALFPLDYYPYNAGEIKSTIVTKIESWGANLFNGEFEQGGIDGSTGQEISADTRCRTDYLEVIGGKTYYLNLYNTTDYSIMVAVAYDKDKKHIQNINVTSLSNGLALPLNAKYLRFVVRRVDNGNIAPSDLANIQFMLGCIKPYVPYVGKLGEINIPNAPLRLDGVNNIHNTLTFEEQSDGTYNAILTRKIKIDDLGELNYTYYAPSDAYPYGFFVANIVGKKNNSNNLLCKEYSVISSQPFTHDKNMVTTSTNGVYIVDSSYTDATSFKTAKSGVKLYFELATPTTEVIATGLSFDQVATLFEKGGTLKIGNANTDYVQTNSTMAFAVRRFKTEE